MRYRTAFGSFVGILGLGPAAIALTLPSAYVNGLWWPMLGLGVAVLCVFGWVLLATRYVIEQGVLDIRVGPIQKRIPLSDITAVHRHRMTNGPTFGLGSDFIGIEYGERAVNVSPRDVDGFIKAVWQGRERLRPGDWASPVPS